MLRLTNFDDTHLPQSPVELRPVGFVDPCDITIVRHDYKMLSSLLNTAVSHVAEVRVITDDCQDGDNKADIVLASSQASLTTNIILNSKIGL